MKHEAIPDNLQKYVTYGQIVVDCRHPKDKPYHYHLTLGSNLIKYPGQVNAQTSDLTTAKLQVNSTILASGAQLMCCDIKNFILARKWISTSTFAFH